MREALLTVLLVLVSAPAAPVSALGGGGASQDTAALRRAAEQRLGTGVSQDDILRRLRESGMTRSQVQARLQQMGYDSRLADRYFDAMERGDSLRTGTPPSDELVDALSRIGLQLRARADSLGVDSLLVDSAAVAEARKSRIFGKELFARATREFEPVLTGPVSGDYRLGPGDQVWLILTGDVERSYPLTVTREGFLIIPQVGQVPVNGLTVDQLEDRLYTHLARSYSGVRRGPEATTRFQASLGELRASHVYVVGEVERPSGYQVSPMATVFNALYRAGGPNEIGSFRHVLVRRGGRIAGRVDLYPYLLAGEATDDIRLEQGDIVFVPLAGPRVTIEGAVRREGIYELVPLEGLRDALAFAGGLRAEGILRRVQIDRILPPGEREPGRERSLIDVDMGALLDREASLIPLQDGDIIRVFSVADESRNRVVVTGGVRKPGEYEWQPGLTLPELVSQAEGLQDGAYTERALIYRMQEDGTRRMLRAPPSPAGLPGLPLADRDSVVVLHEDSLRLPMEVGITGYVKEPGSYTLAEGMSIQDLILAAGGFAEGANYRSAEVARNVDPTLRTGETADVISVALTAPVPGSGTDGAGLYAPDGVPRWLPEADEFVLTRGDRVYIRRAPGYEPARRVIVAGEVMLPGEYELGTRATRVSDIVGRAGGLTPEAYLPGFTIIRDGRPIAGDLTRALNDPAAASNLLLEAGDSLHVPTFDGTVEVSGAVLLEARVLYRQGRSLRQYIERAGGFAQNADRSRVVVTYPSGEREVVDRFLFFRRDPGIEPGSSIFVPTLPPEEREGVNWGDVISRTTAVLSTLLTLYLAINQ
ncbi:MAG TPA: SLBB domain-containing protein [Gemmatimonadota bacterium]|nr:SLBB domain-containing protein [Gemmatimonadota bacterium]